MSLEGIQLNPSKKYIERYKNGRINFAGTIRNVVNDLPNEDVFTGSSMAVFLMKCGLGSEVTEYSNKVQSSLASLSKREPELVKQPGRTSYYRVEREESTIDFSAGKRQDDSEDDEKESWTIDQINMDLFGHT